MPISGRTAPVSSTTSCPSTSAVPLVGSSTVERIFTSVVLPAPFGPSIPCTSPIGIVSEPPLRGRSRVAVGGDRFGHGAGARRRPERVEQVLEELLELGHHQVALPGLLLAAEPERPVPEVPVDCCEVVSRGLPRRLELVR